MAKRNTRNKPRQSRIERLERKCDRILSELLIIRHRLASRPDMDVAIERLHLAACRMKTRFERERDEARRVFHSKLTE